MPNRPLIHEYGIGAYGEYGTTQAFHTATTSGLLLVLIPLIASA